MEIPEGTKFKMFVEAHKQFLRIKLKRELEKKDFILSEKDVTETVAKNKEHLKKPHFNFSEYDIEDIFQESEDNQSALNKNRYYHNIKRRISYGKEKENNK